MNTSNQALSFIFYQDNYILVAQYYQYQAKIVGCVD